MRKIMKSPKITFKFDASFYLACYREVDNEIIFNLKEIWNASQEEDKFAILFALCDFEERFHHFVRYHSDIRSQFVYRKMLLEELYGEDIFHGFTRNPLINVKHPEEAMMDLVKPLLANLCSSNKVPCEI